MIPGIMAGQMRVAGSAAVDPYWGNVVALLHFDGVEGGSTFTDETGRAWTRSNTGIHTTTGQSVFGGSSLSCPNQIGPYLTTDASTDFDFGTGDFTIEMYMRPTVSTGVHIALGRQIDSPAGLALQVRLNGLTPEVVLRGRNGGTVFTLAASTPIPINEFSKVAIHRESGTVRLYIGTELKGSGSCAFDLTAASSRGAIIGSTDGSTPGSNSPFGGQVDELRITKGVARDLTVLQTGPFPSS